MTHRIKNSIKVFAIIAVIAAAIFALTACGNSSNNSSEKDSDTTVRIGTMDLVNGDLVARYEKAYKKALGVKDVKIIKFDSGKDVNNAIASGSIDISQLGTAPVALGISNNLDYEVVGVADVIGSSESLVVKNSTGVKDVKSLKGKKIGTPFASTSHYSLLNALRLAGLKESDVTLLDLQPDDIYAAWKRGDIDAAYVWYPTLDKLVADGGHIITGSDKLAKQNVITADAIIARTDFAKKHPKIVSNYLKVILDANNEINTNKSKAAKAVSSELGISQSDAQNQLGQFSYLNGKQQLNYLNNKIPQTLKQTADFLVEQKSIKKAASAKTFKNKVNTKYMKDAVN